MIEEVLEEREMAFAEELGKYECMWVAILNFGSNEETIVANGETLKEARRAAEDLGYLDVAFLKVPSIRQIFIP